MFTTIIVSVHNVLTPLFNTYNNNEQKKRTF